MWGAVWCCWRPYADPWRFYGPLKNRVEGREARLRYYFPRFSYHFRLVVALPMQAKSMR
jgi:hypothetical protein